MTTYTVQRIVTRDSQNALCRGLYIIINGQACRPTKTLGYVWGPRTWADGVTRYSRKELVFEAQGKAYRMGRKTAKPLKCAADETLREHGFSGNDTNAFLVE